MSAPPQRHGTGVDRDLAVSMRDGTTILVGHHWPRSDPDGPGVVVWIRTAYGRKGMRTFAKRFSKLGAHVVVEAVRGSDGSQGSFEGIRLRADDGADTAEWLRRQAWYPGCIVTWGHSFLGNATWWLAQREVPDWAGAVLHDTQAEARPVVFPGGVFNSVLLALVVASDWLDRHPRGSMARFLLASVRGARRIEKALDEVPLGTVDERVVGRSSPFLREWLQHADDEAYWDALNQRQHAAGMPDQIHLATGWFDTGLASTLLDFAALREAGKRVRLVVGPWYHGRGFADRAYRAEVDRVVTSATRRDVAVSRTSVRLHVGGADEWREFADWPPAGARPTSWHLHPNGVLRTTPPPASQPDRVRYDPADPTPAVGGAQENWTNNAGARDNRRLESRSDVLVYTSDELAGETEIVGPVTATVFLRSSNPYADLFVRLCDVAPNGRSTNLCDGIRRIRPDDSDDESADADGVRTVRVDLLGVAHRFRAGHRIRVQVSGGAHPRLVRNLGTGEQLSTGTGLRASDREILHDPARPSRVVLPVHGGAT